MILKALYDYYYRLKEIDSTIPPYGFKEQEIPFLIVIDKEGNFVRIEDRRIDKKISQTFFVVADSRSSGIKPYLMYDNMEYVFGIPKDDNKNTIAKAPLKHAAFVEKCRALHEKYPDCEAFASVVAFYDKREDTKVPTDNLWDDMVKKVGANVSFLLQGKTEIAASAGELENEVAASDDDSSANGELPICLITGNRSKVVETTKATSIPQSQATAKLVAFQVNSGYDSYGKSKGFNAPISIEAESAYTTALLRLISKQSRNKFTIGNRTFLFWASSNSENSLKVEEGMNSLFGQYDQAEGEDDDPNKRIELVRSVFMSIYNGQKQTDDEDRFFILGLAPNSARIAVVYWNETTVREFAGMILKHFSDMEIVDGRKEKRPYYGLRNMMSAVALGGKVSEVQPNLPEATIKSIIQGIPYPTTLFNAAIRRIRAEQSDPIPLTRLAIIKAYLNRINNNNEKNITIMLDKSNTNAGYLTGRLFAVLEYSQKQANGITTIKERYMNSASSTPAKTFPTLLNLNVHHVEKIDNPATHIYIENMKGEIISMLPAAGFPRRLDLADQGRFFIGYHHQMQDIYTKKNKDQE